MVVILCNSGFASKLQGITDPLYRFIHDQVMAELLNQNLLREIRGDKWVVVDRCSTQYLEEPCVNCYAYANDPEGGDGMFCLNHLDMHPGTSAFRRMSYLQFMKMSSVWCKESVFTSSRPGISNHSHENDFLSEEDEHKFRMITDSCPDIKYLELDPDFIEMESSMETESYSELESDFDLNE